MYKKFVIHYLLLIIFLVSFIRYDVPAESVRSWYTKVGEFGNKAFNDIAAAMYDREDEILNYFVNRSTNASAESLNAKIKQFRALPRGIVDKRFFLFRLTKIYA